MVGLAVEGGATWTRSPSRKKVVIAAFTFLFSASLWSSKDSLSEIAEYLANENGVSSALRWEPLDLPSAIDRIYYINLAESTGRRDFMEGWLKEQHASPRYPTIPFERVDAKRGTEGVCNPWKSTKQGHCVGTSGVIYSNLKIIEDYNTTGITLVLEDDYRIFNLAKIDDVLRTPGLIPDDWDTIRFNCWDIHGTEVGRLQMIKDFDKRRRGVQLVRTHCTNSSYSGPRFFGGAHVSLWKDSAVPKLKEIWSRMPLDDLDVRLWTSEMNNYCIQLGKSFGTDEESYGSTIPR